MMQSASWIKGMCRS